MAIRLKNSDNNYYYIYQKEIQEGIQDTTWNENIINFQPDDFFENNLTVRDFEKNFYLFIFCLQIEIVFERRQKLASVISLMAFDDLTIFRNNDCEGILNDCAV